MTGRDCAPKTARDDFDHLRGNKSRYFVIVNGSEECKILVSPGSQSYVLYPDEEKTQLFKKIRIEAVRLTTNCVDSTHWDVQEAIVHCRRKEAPHQNVESGVNYEGKWNVPTRRL